MKNSRRQSGRLVPTGWHWTLLHGDRTYSRYWGWSNKPWTRAGDGNLSHPEGDGKCRKADIEQSNI